MIDRKTLQFYIGQKVYLAIDHEKNGMVTGILYRETMVYYAVVWDFDLQERYHQGFEIFHNEFGLAE